MHFEERLAWLKDYKVLLEKIFQHICPPKREKFCNWWVIRQSQWIILNTATGQSLSVLEIAHKVIEAFDLDVSNLSFMPDRYGQVQKHIASYEKAKELLRFVPEVTFDNGLRQTITWYKENRALWEKQIPLRRVPVKAKDGSIIWY